MEGIVHNVGDLSSPARSAVEGILGHPLRNDQQLYIVAVDPVLEPAATVRRQAWVELESIILDAHQATRQSNITEENVVQLIDEECNEVRYGSNRCGSSAIRMC